MLITLREKRGLSGLVLGDFHGHVLLAPLAKCLLGLRDVNLFSNYESKKSRIRH
jgi:hypothetical protein